MIKRLCDLWKWLAALLLLAAVAIALLIAEPPDIPVLVVVSDFLSKLWTRPFPANQSYGATLPLVIQATVLVVLLWFAARLASRIVRAQFLDRRQLDKAASSPASCTSRCSRPSSARASRFPSRSGTCICGPSRNRCLAAGW